MDTLERAGTRTAGRTATGTRTATRTAAESARTAEAAQSTRTAGSALAADGGHQRAALLGDLRRLGVLPGEVLLVQASLRALGPVAGGPATVVGALLEALGGPERGTLVAYTATPENSDTSRLAARLTAGLSPAELTAHRDRLRAAYRPDGPCSPTMGALSEQIRTTPGALRSAHPQTSFAALGRYAAEVTAGHELTSHLGESSPLGRLYGLAAKVLMVGVPLSRFTAFHLADLRQGDPPRRRYGCVAEVAGRTDWVSFEAPDLDDLHFGALGEQVRREAHGIRAGRLGDAHCLLVPIVEAVDVATRVLRGSLAPH